MSMEFSGVSSTTLFRNKLSKYFGAHGRFCASHPWEVIVSIVTLTVCALSMSVLSGGKVSTVCGFSKPCQPKPVDEERADTVMLSIVNSLAVIYIYNQFSSLRRAGSKYLLGIAGLFTIFSSFVFGSTVVNFIDNKVSGLNEALPFFLLLIDLSKASALAKIAFKSRNREEVRENIGRGIATLGPTMTLDTLVEVLLISIGTISGVPRFETMCCFGCMSIIASYLVFMTFFPASLALVLEVCPHDPSNSGWHLDNLARDLQEEESKKPNPVAQRVKIIMTLGLFVVHLHSRFLSNVTGLSFGFGLSTGPQSGDSASGERVGIVGPEEMEVVPLPQYLWWKMFNFSLDQMIAILLSCLLFIKYIFFDKSETFSSSSSPSHDTQAPPTPFYSHGKPTTPPNPHMVSCPFALPKSSGEGLVANGKISVSANHLLSAAMRGSQAPKGMEKLMTDGVVIESESAGFERGERPALPASAAIASITLKELSREESDGSRLGGMTRNRSSVLLQQLVGGQVPPPFHSEGSGATGAEQQCQEAGQVASELGGKSLLEWGCQVSDVKDGSILHPETAVKPSLAPAAVQCVSVGTQTDLQCSAVSAPIFSVGGEVERNDSVPEPEGEPSKSTFLPSDLPPVPRQLDECITILKSDDGAKLLTDQEVMKLVDFKHVPAYKLENVLGDHERGVSIRRQMLAKKLANAAKLSNLPFTNYPHYSVVNGACCENVIGYMPIPVGYAGPLLLDGVAYHVPMSTTEGTLVASTNRGCRAVSSAGGVSSSVLDDGMTRGPVVRLPTATQASEVKVWLDDSDNFQLVEEVFNSTSRFARLKRLQTALAGRLLYIRFKASTGDAMGMNMLSKGVEKSLEFVNEKFPLLEVISLSGNFCTDKKPSAINWVEGRGKSVVCEAIIPSQIVTKVLKTTVDALVELNLSKNLVGSAMAGSIGGFNAHAANVVTAIFVATGQDPAQNVTSSNCITLMEHAGAVREDLRISCTMPSIEIGTVGGGTILPPQAACLNMLGVQGPNQENPGGNAAQLARIVCATVLAGELSLLSALAAGHLVKSHLTYNRSQLNLSSIAEGKETHEHRRTNSATAIPPVVMQPAPGPHQRRASCVP